MQKKGEVIVDENADAKKDPRLADIYKGISDIHAAADRLALVAKIPDVKVARLVLEKPPVIITGPYNRVAAPPSFGLAFGTTVSTYPHLKGKRSREGDPICDSYRVHTHENGSILCVADGCGWGERPKEASNRLKDNFVTYLTKNMGKVKTARELAQHLITALAVANFSISYDKPDVWMAGTSTCLGGVLLETLPGQPGIPPWIFVFASIGDCKAFKFDPKTRTCVDLTAGNRNNLTDPRDPGGRLGPQSKTGGPDLRNLDLHVTYFQPGDILLLFSDGVHDNFDPQNLGKSPRDLGMSHDTWDTVPNDLGVEAKNRFMNQKLAQVIMSEGDPNPSLLAKLIMRYCRDITSSSRQWMEQNPHGVLESDYVKYPGKLDHTTVVAIMVGRYTEGQGAVEQRAINQQVWPFG